MNATTDSIDRQTDERFRKAETRNTNEERDDHGFHATAHAPQQIMVQIDKGVAKQFMLIFWVSAVMTALAVIGLFMAWQGMRYNIAHTNVLQYDLMDLRSKTGHSHENTE